MSTTTRLTFDEWFERGHGGATFDEIYLHEGGRYDDAIRALTRHVRDYVSELPAMDAPPREARDGE